MTNVKTKKKTSTKKVEVSDFKGHPVLSLNAQTPYPFSFGLSKAKLILENIDTIKRFVSKFDKK